MSQRERNEFYVERISNVSHANGVFRITLSQQAEEDAVEPVVKLFIPANQLGVMLQSISNAAKDIGEQVQARIEEDSQTTDKKKKK